MPPKHTWINIRFQMQAICYFQISAYEIKIRLLDTTVFSILISFTYQYQTAISKIRISYMLFHILSFPYEIPVKIIQ